MPLLLGEDVLLNVEVIELVIELESLPVFVGVIVLVGVIEAVNVCVVDRVLLGVPEIDKLKLEEVDKVIGGVEVPETDMIKLVEDETVDDGVIEDVGL